MRALHEREINGRLCIVAGSHRARIRVGWGYFTMFYLRWQDGAGPSSMPAGEFNKRSRGTGREIMPNAGHHIVIGSGEQWEPDNRKESL